MDIVKVLLVEDEVILAGIIKDTLEKCGFDVTCAVNGDEGIELFYELKPDIIVVDIMMPKLDGFTLVKLIRQGDKHTPILFLSAKSMTKDVVKGFEVGGNDYLKKPFAMDELIVRIKALLGRVDIKDEQQHVYNLGEYVFNVLEQKLVHTKKTETLSYREAAILENKNVLLDLWGDDSFFNTRSLHVFIVKLRKKLSLDPTIKIINVRGIGYKIIY